VLQLLIELQHSILPPGGSQKYFKSKSINPEDIQKPWTEKKDPKKEWHTILPLLSIGFGVALVALTAGKVSVPASNSNTVPPRGLLKRYSGTENLDQRISQR
jgi:hypothetical protein